ncbi:MAG: restriction endonuclease subunit S [Bacillus sp. (in: Bacteria)]|nr:restriction endonuclease subunit S [Bacillus sp. (in: firmicutes)]
MKFKYKKIKDIAVVYSGTTPSTSKSEYWNGNIKWITPAELQDGHNWYIYDTERKITDEAVRSKNLKMLKKGTILLTTRAPIGKVALVGEVMCTNQGFKNIECNTDVVNPEFLYFWLLSKKEYLNSLGRGATFKEISKTIVENIQVPVPPLGIQGKIVEILKQSLFLIDKRKAQIESLDQLTQSVFLEMFGDIRINSKKFKQVKLNEVITKITTGKSLAGEGISEYKVLKTSAVSYKFFKQNEVKYLPQDYVPPVSHIVNKGDVLVSRMNTSELVGAAAYVFNEIKNVALPDRIWKLHYSRKINPIFLWYFINQSYFRDKVTDIATGTSGSMKNISQKKYLNLSILLPDISLQNKFAEFVYKIQIEKDKMDKGLIELNNIFNSLMQRTFNGKLFPE